MTQTLSSQNLTLILPNWRGKGLEKCMTGFLTSTFLHLRKHIAELVVLPLELKFTRGRLRLIQLVIHLIWEWETPPD